MAFSILSIKTGPRPVKSEFEPLKSRLKTTLPQQESLQPSVISRKRSVYMDRAESKKQAFVNFELPMLDNSASQPKPVDTRIDALISLMDRAYVAPVERSIEQILQSIDALKVNDEEAEKTAALLKKERERFITSAVARKVRQALHSKEYSFSCD